MTWLYGLASNLIISRSSRPDSPTLVWSSLQHLLENAVPHVLIILDCCYAANAARDTAEGTTKELLAACGRENPTSGVGIRSFTSALIEELQAFGETRFTVAMLHSRLVTIRWRLSFTPIYALLSEHGGHSIELASLPLPIENTQSPAAANLQTNNGSSEVTSSSMQLSPSQQSSSSAVADTRVLLAVSIANDAVPDISEWKKWLTSQAPLDVTKVEARVEAVFESHSTMLLTSLSIAAWDQLPHRTAYRFVGFVKSENIQLHYVESGPTTEKLKAQADRMPLQPLTLERGPTAGPSSKLHPDDVTGQPRVGEKDIVRSTPANIGRADRTRLFSPSLGPPLQSLSSPQITAKDDFLNIPQERPGETRSSPLEPISKGVSTERGPHHETSVGRWNGIWTPADDMKLVQARYRGVNWNAIWQIHFPSRTANICLERYKQLIEKHKNTEKQEVDYAPDIDFASLVTNYLGFRESTWQNLLV
ncbi:MAG: hypothetical protein Q9179_000914 [Wetmoreana sp. 5 TL-2023]